jgi:hypothetical protein
MRADTILQGVVGSTAYGLARDGSDVDRLGIFVAPTYAVAGLDWHPSKETRAGDAGGDHVEHEVGKYLRLALKANPTITELLWLDGWEVESPAGQAIVSIRSSLLSTRTVLAAYLGYASAQAAKMARSDGALRLPLAERTDHRAFKNARHCLRLLDQAQGLLVTGDLIVRVADPDRYWSLGAMTADEYLNVYAAVRDATRRAADRSVLPETPDRALAARTLQFIRRQSDLTAVGAHWFEPGPPPPSPGDEWECCASGSCEVCRR